MYELMIVVFVIGYACITVEHQLKVDKAAIALITEFSVGQFMFLVKKKLYDLII